MTISRDVDDNIAKDYRLSNNADLESQPAGLNGVAVEVSYRRSAVFVHTEYERRSWFKADSGLSVKIFSGRTQQFGERYKVCVDAGN